MHVCTSYISCTGGPPFQLQPFTQFGWHHILNNSYSFSFTPHIPLPIHVVHHNLLLPSTHPSIVVNLPFHSKIFTDIIVNNYYCYNANKVCFSLFYAHIFSWLWWPLFWELLEFLFKLFVVGLDAMNQNFSSLTSITEFLMICSAITRTKHHTA